MATENNVVFKLVADISKFQSDMKNASTAFQNDIKSMTNSLGALPAAFEKFTKIGAGLTALLAGGKMFGDIIDTTKGAAAEVLKLTKVFGITAEDASVLRVALDDAFLTVDEAVGASDRLTRAAIKNGQAFKAAGIDIHDANTGGLKDSLTIMMEVNDYLKTLKEGKERDTAAMALYGRGWREFSGILRLTSDGMRDAKARAEELHLIFGEDKMAAMKKYKTAMKDVKDVAESLKVSIGIHLIPILTDLAVTFGDVGTAAADAFAKMTKGGVVDVKTSKLWWGKQYDDVKALVSFLQTGDSKEYSAQIKATQELYQWNLERISQKYGGITTDVAKAKTRKPSGDNAPDFAKKVSDNSSLHSQYLEYSNAFDERVLAGQKASNAKALEENRQAYEEGLTDLDTYIKEKKRLTVESLQLEINAKTSELLAAQKAMREAEKVVIYNGQGERDTDRETSTKYAAWKKEEDAQKALAQAYSNLEIEKTKLNFADREQINKVRAGYAEQQAALEEYMGNYLNAALLRQQVEDRSEERRKLRASADSGDIEAQKALLAVMQKNAEALKLSTNAGDWFSGVTAGLTNFAKQASDVGGQVKDAMERAFKGMEDALVNFTQTGKLNFSDFAKSVLTDIERILIRANITGPLAEGLKGIEWGKMFSGFFGSANGNVFSGGNPVAYALGGVVSRPTFFPMANGGTGLMGEAGPEAIMPLRRLGNGRLGIDATGAGGTPDMTVNIINQSGQQVKAKSQGPATFDGRGFVKTVILEALDTDPGFRGAVRGY